MTREREGIVTQGRGRGLFATREGATPIDWRGAIVFELSNYHSSVISSTGTSKQMGRSKSVIFLQCIIT